MRLLKLLLLLSLIILPVSCWPGYTSPVSQPPRTPEERRYHQIWDSARSILKDYGFNPEFQDKREGLLTTYAITSGHLLEEIWKKDHSSIGDITENSLHTIYRAVRLRFIRSGSKGFDITVEIAKARSNMPEAHVTDSSEALGMSNRTLRLPPRLTFNDLQKSPVITKKTPLPKDYRQYPSRLKDEEHPILVALGRDTKLEERLAGEIRTAAGLPQSGLTFEDPGPPVTPPPKQDK